MVCLQAEDPAVCHQVECHPAECRHQAAFDPKVLAETQATCSVTLCRSDRKIKFVSDTYKLTKLIYVFLFQPLKIHGSIQISVTAAVSISYHLNKITSDYVVN